MKIENGVLYQVYDDDIVNGELIIPNSVSKIGDGAFWNCKNLESIIVNDSNEYHLLDDGVLFNKDKTKLVKYPEGKKDKKYIIPISVTEIGEYAFDNCINLESIKIPNSVTKIEFAAFSNCNRLKSIVIPDSVIEINNNVFYCCNELESINVNDGNEQYSSKDGVLFNKEQTKLIQYPQGKKGKIYIISDSVTVIGNDSFDNCPELETIIISNSVTEIKSYAFNNCINLTSINIPASVTEIGGGVFCNCKRLEPIVIPDLVNTIYPFAFKNCKSLQSKLGNYKAFRKGLICMDMQYKPNEWNKVKGEINICEWGLHYVTNLFDIFNYYYGNLEEDIEIWEVEVGDIIMDSDEDSKKATNAIFPKYKLNQQEIINVLNNKI